MGAAVTKTPARATARLASARVDCIAVRLWPRRCLTCAEEETLTAQLHAWRSEQGWTWSGELLRGEMRTDDEFSAGDVVDSLCALLGLEGLARIELSQPHAGDREPPAWLGVQRSNPDLKPLCDLYRDRLLAADIVIQALGGFVMGANGLTSSSTNHPRRSE